MFLKSLKKLSVYLTVLLLLTESGIAGGIETEMTDYSLESSWARLANNIDKPVDVFYVYPTVYGDKTPLNMDFDLPEMRAKVEIPLNSQLSVFEDSANSFAPYYRQISGVLIEDMEKVPNTSYYKLAKKDVFGAFKYYIENLNNGRPFILAGHSQGSMLLIDVMRECMNEDICNRMIGAYLIGFSVLKGDIEKYSWMRQAKRSNDTGVIISYNTQSPSAEASPVLLEGAICINPLSWSTEPIKASKDLNMGAVFYGSDGEVVKEASHYCGAEVSEKSGALIAQPPESLDVSPFPEGVFHKYDYAFWYRNLEDNVEERISAYFGSDNAL